MTWVRIDENFPEHPKTMAAGDDAAWWFVCALAYCNRQLTDGLIPAATVRRLTNHKHPIALAMKLVEVGLLERTDDGFMVHDFLNYQPSKASVEDDRRKARERMAKARGTSADVRPNKPRSSPNPIPSRPVPDPQSSSSSSTGSSNGARHVDEDDDERIIEAIDIHARWASRNADNPRSYQRTVKANDRRDFLDDLHKCIATNPDVDARKLASSVFEMTEVDVASYAPRHP
jgi:hypothetical protein